jgi:peptide deformylase
LDEEPGHLINPDLDLSEELQIGDEGCLSLPDLAFETPRSMRVVAKGMNMWGETVVIEGSELLARAVQHETDHLDGILFIDRLDPELRKEAMRQIREAEWFGEQPPAVQVSPHSISSRWL